MMTRSFSSVFAGVVLALAVSSAGCGGASNPKPAPLGRHFDDKYIDPLPVDQQSGAIAAKGSYEVAKREYAKANADFEASKVQIDVATNEKKTADIDVSSAKSRKSAADTSADQTRVNAATGELRGAEKYAEALNQRLTYLREYRAWLENLLYYTEENMYWQEATYELAKAELARTNNIQPAGFVFDDYAKQQTDRKAKVATRKDTAESKRRAALDARTKWISLQAEADKLLNKTSSFDDPMANATSAGTTSKQDGGAMDLGGGGSKTDAMVPKAEDAVNPTEPSPAPTTP